MPKLVVASVQQQMRLFDNLEDYRKELNRFLYLARAKGARLIVFPALAGVMAATPQVEGFRVNLLRRADERNRRTKTLWSRTRSALAGSTANLLKVSFRKAFTALAEAEPDVLRTAYESVFSGLAQAYGMTVVAGSAYLKDRLGGMRQRAEVFGPNGETLGVHDKVAPGPEDEGLAAAGSDWTVVDTPAGRLGILLGEEALYPEAGRILAYQGAELLVALAATTAEATAAYIRQAVTARAQENQCFALSSFLVGTNYLADKPGDGGEFVGKSGIYAPLEMTPRFSGALVEMGAANSEGLLTAELDRDELAALWQSGAQPLRRRAPVRAFASYLPPIYAGLRTLGEAASEAGRVPAAVQQARLLGTGTREAAETAVTGGPVEPPIVLGAGEAEETGPAVSSFEPPAAAPAAAGENTAPEDEDEPHTPESEAAGGEAEMGKNENVSDEPRPGQSDLSDLE